MISYLLGLAFGMVASAPPVSELPFTFEVRAEDRAAYERLGKATGMEHLIPLQVGLDGETAGRIDVLQRSGRAYPRWRWIQAAALPDPGLHLEGAADAESLLVIRYGGRAGYLLEGPFRWPQQPGQRRVKPSSFRTISGDARIPAEARFRLLGEDGSEPPCETDGASKWQCVGIPAGADSILAVCGPEGMAYAETRTRPVQLTPIAWGAVAAVSGGDGPVEVTVFRQGPVGSRNPLPPDRYGYRPLDKGKFWVFGLDGDSEQVLRLQTAGGFGAAVPFASLSTPGGCAETTAVELQREGRLFGTIADREGTPLAGATVFVLKRKEDAQKTTTGGPAPVIATAEANEVGHYEVPGLREDLYRIRACHAAEGCEEKEGRPSSEPVDVRIAGARPVRGRVLSTAGVPEPGAVVRIVPRIQDYAAASDRVRYFPMETAAGGDGRFRISAPSAGTFVLEASSPRSGTARREVSIEEAAGAALDVGDVLLSRPAEFTARLRACAGGMLRMSGPIDGRTSLPNLLDFPIDQEGLATVQLPDGGTWTLAARCGEQTRILMPPYISDVERVAGTEVPLRFAEADEEQ